jgi:cell division protein FtsZ
VDSAAPVANRHNESESQSAMNCIRRYAADDAHIIYGAAYDESLGDQLRVTVIATGLSPTSRRQAAPLTVVQQTPLQRTGTDNLPVLNQVAQGSTTAAPSAPPVHDYGGLNTPSVWRSGRTAAAKVDALANHGMDEIEIPAFLRKQAD